MYVVRYTWQGESYRTLPMSKVEAQECAVVARAKFAGVEILKVSS